MLLMLPIKLVWFPPPLLLLSNDGEGVPVRLSSLVGDSLAELSMSPTGLLFGGRPGLHGHIGRVFKCIDGGELQSWSVSTRWIQVEVNDLWCLMVMARISWFLPAPGASATKNWAFRAVKSASKVGKVGRINWVLIYNANCWSSFWNPHNREMDCSF